LRATIWIDVLLRDLEIEEIGIVIVVEKSWPDATKARPARSGEGA
jgi:hypothetical protein